MAKMKRMFDCECLPRPRGSNGRCSARDLSGLSCVAAHTCRHYKPDSQGSPRVTELSRIFLFRFRWNFLPKSYMEKDKKFILTNLGLLEIFFRCTLEREVVNYFKAICCGLNKWRPCKDFTRHARA